MPVTRWVPRSLGVLAVLVVSAAGAPATALAAPVPAAATSRAIPQATDDDARPLGGLISTVLRLAGVRTGAESGCDGVDWRQGVTVLLEPCQATGAADTVGLAGSDSRPEAGGGSAPVASAGATAPLRATDDDGNLAGGRPTSSSSAVEGSPPAHAVDDTVDTAWRARGGNDWWQVDLGRATGLSAVIVNWDAHALPTGYTLQVSKDGDRWTRAGKARGRPNGGPTVLELSRIDGVKGRFVRVQAKGPVDGDAGIALRDVRVFGAASAAKGGQSGEPAAGALLPGTGAFTGLPDLGDGLVPSSDVGAVQAGASTGSGGPDPLTTAAMLVIVIAGVTGLVIGQTAGGGRHRQRGVAAVRLAVQRLRELERMPRPGSPRSPGSPGTP